jgi:ataxin-3
LTSHNDAERDVLDDETGTFPEASSDPYPDEDAEDEELDDDTYEDALDDDLRGARGGRRQEPVLDFSMQSRSYDDEDAALQAALKASMDDLPPGWEPPKEEPKPKIGQKKATPTATTPSAAVADHVNTGGVASGPVAGSQFKEELDDDDDGPAEVVSAGRSY